MFVPPIHHDDVEAILDAGKSLNDFIMVAKNGGTICECKNENSEMQKYFYGKLFIGGSGYGFLASTYVSLGTIVCWSFWA